VRNPPGPARRGIKDADDVLGSAHVLQCRSHRFCTSRRGKGRQRWSVDHYKLAAVVAQCGVRGTGGKQAVAARRMTRLTSVGWRNSTRTHAAAIETTSAALRIPSNHQRKHTGRPMGGY